MADVEDLRLTLFAEMRGRIKEDDSSVPAPDGDYAYATRYEEGGEHPLIVRTPARRQRRDGAARRQRDGAGARPISASAASATAPTTGCSPIRSTTRARSTSPSTSATPRPARTLPTASRAPPATRSGRPTARPSSTSGSTRTTARRGSIATSSAPSQSADVVVYEDHHPGFFIGVGETQSRRFVIIDDPRPRDVGSPRARRRPAGRQAAPDRAAPDRREEYHLDHGDDRFFILTNADGAEDFKIVTAPVATPGRRHWSDLVPHVPGRLILNLTVYKDYLVRLEREASLPRIVIRHLADRRGARHRLRRGGLFARHARTASSSTRRRCASPIRR